MTQSMKALFVGETIDSLLIGGKHNGKRARMPAGVRRTSVLINGAEDYEEDPKDCDYYTLTDDYVDGLRVWRVE